MKKDDYFNISVARKVSMRCPILDYCMRRAYTIYFFSDMHTVSRGRNEIDTLVGEGFFPKDLREKYIEVTGEQPRISRGENYGGFYNMCPEVSLFDSEHNFGFTNGNAYSSCSWDFESPKKGVTSFDTKHFTECAEYSKQQFVLRGTKNRKKIPNKTRATLQKEIHSKCPFCKNEDVEHFEVHHIDESPNNNELENLILICPTCHSKITKGDIAFEIVVKTKLELAEK